MPEANWQRRLTPAGLGGIHVVAISGPKTASFLAEYFRPAKRQVEDKKLTYGRLVDGDDLVDEALVWRREDGAELSIHGGPAIERRLSALLTDYGFAEVARQSVLVAADVHAPALYAEAEEALLSAAGPHAVLFFLAVLEGSLAREIASWVDTLVASGVEQDARRVAIEAGMDSLLSRAAFGLAMKDPPIIVLAGPANAGKSSLFNALLGQERAIVDDRAGTTRDLVDEICEIDGYAFRLMDTAGRRQAQSEVEEEGMERARKMADRAALTIEIRDVRIPEDVVFGAESKNTLWVMNKVDVLPEADQHALRQTWPQALLVSAKTAEGLEGLAAQIVFRSALRRTEYP